MTRVQPLFNLTGKTPRWCFLAVLSIFAAGCMGEPEPLRIHDPAKARASILKKMENPDRRPGPSKR